MSWVDAGIGGGAYDPWLGFLRHTCVLFSLQVLSFWFSFSISVLLYREQGQANGSQHSGPDM